MAGIWPILQDLIFPPVCPHCQRDVEPWTAQGRQQWGLCPRCRAQLPRRLGTERWLALLDPRLRSEAEAYLRQAAPNKELSTRDKRLLTLRAEALFYYAAPLTTGLRWIKFRDRPDWALALGHLVAEVSPELLGPSYPAWEALLPLPLSPERQRERGYNQAALLFQELAKRRGLVLAEGYLQKRSGVQRQEETEGQKQRFTGQAGAYYCPQTLPYRSVLLCDDILSSGSTLFHAALALLEAGVQELGFLVLAAGREAEWALGQSERYL